MTQCADKTRSTDHNQNQNSLPELDDGWSCVCQLGTGHVADVGDVREGAVVAVLVTEGHDAVRCVPFIVTGGPGKGGVEGLDQVVEAPGQHHDVVGITEKHDHHGGVTQTWGRGQEYNMRSESACFMCLWVRSWCVDVNYFYHRVILIRPLVWNQSQSFFQNSGFNKFKGSVSNFVTSTV